MNSAFQFQLMLIVLLNLTFVYITGAVGERDACARDGLAADLSHAAVTRPASIVAALGPALTVEVDRDRRRADALLHLGDQRATRRDEAWVHAHPEALPDAPRR